MQQDKRLRVLVVDDHGEMASMIAEELRDRGYDASALTSGREAVHALRKERFDAVVTDLAMPEVDGLAVLRVSQELDPTRPVIMITADASVETAMEATGSGVYQYLRKPFRLDVLRRLLGEAIRLSQAKQSAGPR